MQIERTMTVNRPRTEVYGFWRSLENLPRFMEHIKTVTRGAGSHSRWVVALPMGQTLEWDVALEEQPNERLAWRSLPDAGVEASGVVRFQDAPAGRGTEVRVLLEYNPPGGIAGDAVAKLFEGVTAERLQDEIRRSKQLIETGEIATITGQPSGRDEKAEKAWRSRSVDSQRRT